MERMELGRADLAGSTARVKRLRRFGRSAMDSGPLPPVCRGGQLERMEPGRDGLAGSTERGKEIAALRPVGYG